MSLIDSDKFARLKKFAKLQNLTQHPAFNKSINAYSKQEFATPLVVLRETLAGFSRKNIFGISASLSFYALFALIPLVLLIFFLLSQLVFSSDYAIVKLAIILGNIMPDLSSKIMVEVYSAAQTKAAWGALGLFVLLWTITPLAGAMRSAFYTIASMVEAPSFFRRKLKDVISVFGILLLFFLFTFAGLVVEKSVRFLAAHLSVTELNIVATFGTLILTTVLITLFYKVFLPMRVAISHLLLGALLTAALWLLMRPAFSLFLSFNQNYGAVFGSMKAMFISITWLYFNFAVFLLGIVFIATLHKTDVLLLKDLFNGAPNKNNYIDALMNRYGLVLRQGEYIFERGNTERNLYYLAEGKVNLSNGSHVARELVAGDYFGELAMLTKQPTTSDAIVASIDARIIVIYAEIIDTILLDDPKISMLLLRQMAGRLQTNFN